MAAGKNFTECESADVCASDDKPGDSANPGGMP